MLARVDDDVRGVLVADEAVLRVFCFLRSLFLRLAVALLQPSFCGLVGATRALLLFFFLQPALHGGRSGELFWGRILDDIVCVVRLELSLIGGYCSDVVGARFLELEPAAVRPPLAKHGQVPL